MKPIIIAVTLIALLFTATAEAKKKGKGGKGGKVDKEQIEREQKRDAEKKAVDGVLDKKDTDSNDQLTMEEWLAGEGNVGKATTRFVGGDKNKDRRLTRTEIGAILGF